MKVNTALRDFEIDNANFFFVSVAAGEADIDYLPLTAGAILSRRERVMRHLT